MKNLRLLAIKALNSCVQLLTKHLSHGDFHCSLAKQNRSLAKELEVSLNSTELSSIETLFLPIAFGKIEPRGLGSKVNVKLRMNLFVIGFMTIWLSFALVGAISFLFISQDSMRFIPLGIFIVGYLLMQGGFWFEVPKIRKMIEKIVVDHR